MCASPSCSSSAAANAHGRAVQLRPNDALLQAGYGRALLASGNVNAALPALERARRIDFRDGSMLRDLSVAYALALLGVIGTLRPAQWRRGAPA